MIYTKVDEIRFWSKVLVSKKSEGCWYWKDSKNKLGYGYYRINHKTYLAHRLSLIFFNNGEVAKGMHVLHSCDNPSCCNPSHLRWGTDYDNVHDAISRGRHVKPPRNGKLPPVMRGEDNPGSKVNWEIVSNIRGERSQGASTKYLSNKYGISISTVCQITNYKTWKVENFRKEPQ